MSFYRTAVSVFVPSKTGHFVAKTNFHFIFCGIKNSYAEKSAVFAEFHEFLSSPNYFLGNIFKYVEKNSAIFAENMKKVGVCCFKKVRFSQPFGAKLKIKNL